jgi:hypothetical protein
MKRTLPGDVLFEMTKQRIGDLRRDAESGREYRRHSADNDCDDAPVARTSSASRVQRMQPSH